MGHNNMFMCDVRKFKMPTFVCKNTMQMLDLKTYELLPVICNVVPNKDLDLFMMQPDIFL